MTFDLNISHTTKAPLMLLINNFQSFLLGTCTVTHFNSLMCFTLFMCFIILFNILSMYLFPVLVVFKNLWHDNRTA